MGGGGCYKYPINMKLHRDVGRIMKAESYALPNVSLPL